MRQVILDTETTGISHEQGHRVIEIGCVEIIDRKLTNNNFHIYLNPEREVDEGAFRVHGISNEFLKDKPKFADIHHDFIKFIDGSELIIHNAPFDVGFLNSELKLIQWHKKIDEHCSILDTLKLARKKHPGQRNTLDALCKRYEIDNTNRELHGALLDAELLGYVYLAMTGGQTSLFAETSTEITPERLHKDREISLENALVIKATQEELAEHNGFLDFLKNTAGRNHWEEDIVVEDEMA